MKIGNLPNYIVQVFPDAWNESPERAPLCEGIFTVVLNIAMHVHFVPEVDHTAPPWPADQEPPEDELTTPAQVRWYELVTGTYSVTPNAGRAGRTERIGPLDPPSTVFYVTPDEFAAFTRELAELAELTGSISDSLHRDDVIDRSVIRFIDEQVLESPFLERVHAELVGQDPAATTDQSRD